MKHNAIAAGDVSDHIEQLEDVGAGDHCTLLGPDKGLANAKCLNAVDALWRTNGQAVYVCPHCVFDEDFVHKSS